MNIYEKLLAISQEIATVAKNLNVGVGKSSYKAVGEADILKAVRPLEAKHKVYSYPFSRTIIESGVIENEIENNGTKTIKKNLYERIETVYRFVNIEKPEEFIEITTYGDGIDSQDKSVGKAMTYADKYALMKAYKIVTGDDPDQDESKPLAKTTIKKAPTHSPDVLEQCKELNIALPNVAKAYNKKLEDLTDEDLLKAVKSKREALERKQQAAAQQR